MSGRRSAAGVWRELGFAVFTLAAGAALMLAVSPACANPHWAEDLTGEADPVQQVKAAAGLLRLRPLETRDFGPVEQTGVYPIGANTFFEQEVEEAKVRRSMQMLRDAGVKWIRQEFPWDRIEPLGKGRYQDAFGDTWAAYDRIVSLAAEYGLEVMPRLTLPPNWTRADNSTPRAPPDNYDDYGDFVAAVVQRYKGRVRYYQLWNEPNTELEWGKAPNAADYVRLLRTGYRRAKAADPSVTVIAAALSPTIGTYDGLNQNDLTYLQEMYDAGAAGAFDIMAAQGYGLWTGPGDRRAEFARTNFARVQLLRAVMVRNGDGHKPIWLTEVGWPALPLDFPGEAIHGRVTEDQQARYTLQALRRIRQEWPWVGVAFVWQFRRVSDEQRSQADFYFRMVDPDFTPLPVYYAVQQAAADPPVLERGWRPATHWAIRRSGPWSPVSRSVEGAQVTALTASSPAAVLRMDVRGRALQVHLTALPGGGSLRVLVNGRAAAPLRPYAGDGGALPSTAVINLPGDVSSVELRPAGDGPVEITGLAVFDPAPAPVRELLGAALLLAVLLVTALCLGRGGGRA